MACQEIDSFILKYKNLMSARRNARLNIQAKAGKAYVNLSVELEHPAGCDHPQNHRSKNGPARQRRRLRRAAAREAENAVVVDSEVAKETVGNKVGDIAEEASTEKTSTTKNVIEDLVDEFCSDEEYQKEVEENSEIFKLTYRSLPHESFKSESEMKEDLKRNLSYTFNYYKLKSEDQKYKVVKFEKIDNCLKTLLKVKDIPEVLQPVKGLRIWKMEVRRIPKKITLHPSTLSQ